MRQEGRQIRQELKQPDFEQERTEKTEKRACGTTLDIAFPLLHLSHKAMQKYQRIVTGYHGCDRVVADKVLAGTARLNPSRNAYDWLGQGIYFWEHGPERAREWAVAQAKLSGAKIKEPSVL